MLFIYSTVKYNNTKQSKIKASFSDIILFVGMELPFLDQDVFGTDWVMCAAI